MGKKVVSSYYEEDAEGSSGSEQPSIFLDDVIGEKFKQIKRKHRRSYRKMVIEESSDDDETTEQYYLEERSIGKKSKSQNEGPKKNKGNKKQNTATKSVPQEDSEKEEDDEEELKIKTRVRNQITGNETGSPRFVRWNIKEIFDRKDAQKKPTFLEDLIREGPWEDETDDNEIEEEDCMMEEQVYTPSFNEWVT
ncbi:hypothetical protein ACLB2K_077355 [Fragaria x ananassa]